MSGARPSSSPSLRAYGLHEKVAPQLAALHLDPDRPLLAVDADEVLVDLAAHLARFFESVGYRLDLSEYRFDGAISRISDGRVLAREEGWVLIERFFQAETRNQRAVPGAAEALAELAPAAQIVVLTNVPFAARAARVENLQALGMDYPLIANVGGKGRVLRYWRDRVRAPLAFVDDSPAQLQSAARHAPEVARVHFVGSPALRALLPKVGAAQHHPRNWPECREALARILRT